MAMISCYSSVSSNIREEPIVENNHILIEVIDSIGWLKINRPDSLNVLNSEVVEFAGIRPA